MQSVWRSRLPDRREDPVFEALNASIGFDRRLFREELAGTRAHARVLVRAGVYTPAEGEAVLAALDDIEEELAAGGADLGGFEDIHAVVEARLTEKTGAAGEKIQTGRSRNEQTQTAQRLYLRKAGAELHRGLGDLMEALLDRAEETADVLLPGFTHGRPAQPIRFPHYLASHVFGLERDRERLAGALARLDRSPAGVAALAGATFGLDREAAAADLGFSAPSENALDTVSDRDGQVELLSWAAILMVRLSRMAEDLVLWSSPAYGFLTLGDTFCTSSSLMPQKKNPDGPELVRGKAGRVVGDLVSLLVTLKGLSTGYQKDLQEDKEPLFDALDTARACLHVMAGVVRELEVHADVMAAAITRETLATDEADDLVREGLPFRRAYAEVARRFQGSQEAEDRRSAPPLPAEASVERRAVTGGTAREAVLAQLDRARRLLEARAHPSS